MDPRLEAIPTAALRVVDGDVVAANGPAADLLGVGPAALLDELLADDVDALRAAARSAGTGTTATVEVRSAAGPPRRSFRVDLGPHPDGGAIVVLIETTERRRLEATVHDLATGIYTTDAELRGQWMPERLAHSIGVDRTMFEGLDVYSLVHPDDLGTARSMVARATATPGVAYSSPVRILHPSHLDVYYAAYVHVRWLPDDDALGGLLVRFDTGYLDGALDADPTETGTVSFRDATPLGFVNQSISGEIVQFSFRAREILRPVSDRDDGHDWLDCVRPEDRLVVDEALADGCRGLLRSPMEVGFAGHGRRVWVRLEVLPYRGRSGDVVGVFVNLLDITPEYEARIALAAAREELWEQARHDALTGLCNRVPFVERLAASVRGGVGSDDVDHGWRRRREDPSRRPAVLVCDLDGFKAVNDTHGHRVGDGVLIEVGRRLARSVRADDTLCRYGGDEFLVLCDGVTRAEVDALAARIVATVQEKLVIGGVIIAIGVSVGVAMVEPGDEDDPDELVRRADQAMYRAKNGGGARAVVA